LDSGIDRILNQPVEMIGKIDLSGYPRFYSTDYDISHIRIGSVDCILIKTEGVIKLPAIIKMVQFLESKNSMPCIISTSKLTDYQKKRLSELGIAYIISPNNLYIPFLGISILQSKNRTEPITSLSPQAQYLALHIIDGSWVGLNATAVARTMKKSLPSISNYFKEIEATVPQVIDRCGTRKVLVNDGVLSRGELFRLFEPYLTTPVKDSFYAKFKGRQRSLIDHGYLYAGISALSKTTMLVDSPWKTYATSEYERSDSGEFASGLTVVTVDDDPDILLQIWKYPPQDSGDDTVDDISLYLSLKDSPQLEDPRGEEALAGLLERIAG
jgi:hypothetical protein